MSAERAAPGRRTGTAASAAATHRARPGRTRRLTPEQRARAFARRLDRARPGLVPFVLDSLRSRYGVPTWRVRLDPVSELVLTILTQNTADVNAEKAFEALRARYPSPEDIPFQHHRGGSGPDWATPGRPDGWGGEGLQPGRPPEWARVEDAPIDELIDVIRPGGLANQKAPRIQAALRTIREAGGDYRLDFLGALPPREARDWLTRMPGIGRKTASIVLLFCFGMPLMPIDTHVERVSKRIGLLRPETPLEEAHEQFLEVFLPEQMYEAHVNLITHGRQVCHARNPRCGLCPIAPRCRQVDSKAP